MRVSLGCVFSAVSRTKALSLGLSVFLVLNPLFAFGNGKDEIDSVLVVENTLTEAANESVELVVAVDARDVEAIGQEAPVDLNASLADLGFEGVRGNPQTSDASQDSEVKKKFDSFERFRAGVVLRFAKILKRLRFTGPSGQYFLNHVNDSIVESSKALTEGRQVFGGEVSIFWGAGANSSIMNRIFGESILGEAISKRGGFFYSSAIGFTFSRERTDRGVKYVFEIVSDWKRLKRMHTGFFGIGFDITGAPAYDASTARRIETSAFMTGLGPSVRHGDGFLQVAMSVGGQIPPGLGSTMVLEAEGPRTKLVVLDSESYLDLKHRIRTFFSKHIGRGSAVRCERIFE